MNGFSGCESSIFCKSSLAAIRLTAKCKLQSPSKFPALRYIYVQMTKYMHSMQMNCENYLQIFKSFGYGVHQPAM